MRLEAPLVVRSMYNTGVARRRRLASSHTLDRGRCTLQSSLDRRRAGDLRPPEGVVSRRQQAIPEGPSPCARTKKEVFACLPSGF